MKNIVYILFVVIMAACAAKNKELTDKFERGKRLGELKGPLEVPYEKEPQGESVTWARDGSGFYTLSEKKGKQQSYLYFYALKEMM